MTASPAGDPLAPFVGRTHIAYFSMEIAIREEMHTYARGLGMLAGDTARSAADLELPLVFVTLASRAGYFRQCLDAEGNQGEEPDWWELDAWCMSLDAMVAIRIAGRPVWIRPWLALQTCPHGHSIPILLLDTDLEQNAPEDLFLASIGVRLDLGAVTAIPVFLMLLLVVAFLGKLTGAGLPARLAGLPTRGAAAVGVGISGRGAVELVVASMALEAGLFAQSDILVSNLFSALVITAVITTMLMPVMLRTVLPPLDNEREPSR